MMANQKIHGGSTVVVNGRTHHLPPGSIRITGGAIYVNGQRWNEDEPASGVIELRITGDPIDVFTDASVTVNGNVRGGVTAGGSVNCQDVGVSVSAGGSVNAGRVGGSVVAGGSVVHR